ncbi:hypothetical protein TNCV_2776812 [Trichonephila clavipes]|nr:hypothetical protein TNCV_2776812 [Trichonephila clavipes]
MLNYSLTSIENLRNNFTNIQEETIGLAKKWGITPEFEKKDRKVRQFFDDFNADEKLQDRERLFEVDVLKANVDVITTQLKNRFESMNGIYKSFSFLFPKNIVSTTNDLLYNEASYLQKVYSLDLSSEFPNQIMSLKAVFSEDLIKLNSIKDLALVLRVTCASLSWTTGWWVPTRPPSSSLPSAPDHRPARLESARSILIFPIILRYRSVESDLRVSLVNNGLVGPYSATVLVTLPSAPDHRPPRLASAR